MNKYLLPLSISAALLTGCGASDNSSDSDRNDGVDATPYTSISGVDGSTGYAYFDLDTGKTLELTDEQAATNTEWDIAFYGTSVILNGGHSGSGDVKAYFTGNNADFRDDNGDAIKDKFVNATPETELADFTAITSTDVPADSEFDTDTFTTIFGSGFYTYNPVDHSISENDAQQYLISNADGSYLVRVTDLSNLDGQSVPGRSITEFTLGVKFKGSDDAGYSDEQLVTLAECDGTAYLDLSAYAEVTESDAYDLAVQCSQFEIHLGTDVLAHAHADEEAWSKATQYVGTQYEHYYFSEDGAETIFKDKFKWYEYDLNEGNKIWSQYGVYLINTGNDTYKFQITSYYKLNDDGSVTGRNMSFIYQTL